MDRARVIAKYREWIRGKIAADPKGYDVTELYGKRLGCWCKPQAFKVDR